MTSGLTGCLATMGPPPTPGSGPPPPLWEPAPEPGPAGAPPLPAPAPPDPLGELPPPPHAAKSADPAKIKLLVTIHVRMVTSRRGYHRSRAQDGERAGSGKVSACCFESRRSPSSSARDARAGRAPPSSSSSSTSSSGGAGGGAACPTKADAELPSPPLHTPRWAFEPWISKDISDTDDTLRLRRRVPSIATSPSASSCSIARGRPTTTRSSRIPTRYHDFDEAGSDAPRTKDVRLVVWITQFVNNVSYRRRDRAATPTPAPRRTSTTADRCDFFVDQGRRVRLVERHRRRGRLLQPAARARGGTRNRTRSSTRGVDGFKLDFGDSYVDDAIRWTPPPGPIAHQAVLGGLLPRLSGLRRRSRRGPDFVTMTRGWDVSYEFAGRFYARPEHAPVAWMGDNRRDWVGLADALDEMFRSAHAGYVVLGSDIGGYLDLDDKNLTARRSRSTRSSSRAGRRSARSRRSCSSTGAPTSRRGPSPDTRRDRSPSTTTGRSSTTSSAPFFYSLAEEAYAGARAASCGPIGDRERLGRRLPLPLGDALLVAPILDATGKRDVALPAGARWYDWWEPDAPTRSPGGQTLAALRRDRLDEGPALRSARRDHPARGRRRRDGPRRRGLGEPPHRAGVPRRVEHLHPPRHRREAHHDRGDDRRRERRPSPCRARSRRCCSASATTRASPRSPSTVRPRARARPAPISTRKRPDSGATPPRVRSGSTSRRAQTASTRSPSRLHDRHLKVGIVRAAPSPRVAMAARRTQLPRRPKRSRRGLGGGAPIVDKGSQRGLTPGGRSHIKGGL